jgi:hypothetical protein
MTRIKKHVLTILGLLALLVAGCTSDDSTDSETHWQSALGHCSSSMDCQEGLTCLCGVCTSTCGSDDECGEVDPAAECGLGQAQLPARCVSEASDGEGICLEECSSHQECAERDPQLTCENGRCASAGGQSQPVDEPDADDSQPPQYLFCEDGPVQCCEDLGLPHLREGRPSGSIAFGVVSGPEFEYPMYAHERDIRSGVWHGLGPVAEPVEVSCLDNAADLGLPCEVDYVGLFEDDAKAEYELRLGLPRALLDALPTGEPVEVTRRFGGWTVVSQSNGVPLLANGRRYLSDDPLSLPGFEIRSATDSSQADEAICLTDFDDCQRGFVYTRLSVVADQEHVVDPGAMVDFTADGQRYRLWHVHSHLRYGGQKYGYGSQCADRNDWDNVVSFALIWLGEE